MKKKIIVFAIILLFVFLLSSCVNSNLKAIIKTPDGETIEIEIKGYVDYSNGTMRIKDKNGNIYTTDSKNVLIMGG